MYIFADFKIQKRYISIVDRVNSLIHYPKLRKQFDDNPSSLSVQILYFKVYLFLFFNQNSV